LVEEGYWEARLDDLGAYLDEPQAKVKTPSRAEEEAMSEIRTEDEEQRI